MQHLINNPYFHEEVLTIIVILTFLILRALTTRIVKRYAKLNETLVQRTNLVIKYINILLGTLAFLSIVVIWGVKKDQIFLFISSIFTVIGVATMAQWSILSNITAGVIMFFSYPFKIGDSIKIQDKDFPLEGEIIDIKAFFIILKSKEGEFVTYPNTFLMQKGITLIKTNHFTSTEKEYTD